MQRDELKETRGFTQKPRLIPRELSKAKLGTELALTADEVYARIVACRAVTAADDIAPRNSLADSHIVASRLAARRAESALSRHKSRRAGPSEGRAADRAFKRSARETNEMARLDIGRSLLASRLSGLRWGLWLKLAVFKLAL